MEEKSTMLYFYPSKIKGILIIIFSFVFLGVGVVMCYVSFTRGEYIMSLIGGFTVLISTISIPVWMIILLKSLPILLLTEEGINVNPESKKSILLKWEDVEGYQIQTIRVRLNTLTFIEIILYDEEKYKAQMSSMQRKLNVVGSMNGAYSQFSIFLNQVKRTDRDLLFYALDNITSPDFDIENVPKSSKEKKMDSFMHQINRYFKRSYSISFIMTVLLILFLYSSLDEVNSLNHLIISFALFPFAKFILDIMYLFDINARIENKTDTIKNVYQLIRGIIYFFLFFISPIIGAIGLVYFITIVTRRGIKKEK